MRRLSTCPYLQRKPNHFRGCLGAIQARSPIVGELWGRALLCAVEIVAHKTKAAMLPAELAAADRIRQIGMHEGLLIYGRRTNSSRFGERFVVAPPLTISVNQIDDMLD